MNRFVVLLAMCLVVVGCEMTKPTDQQTDDTKTVVVDRASAAEIWQQVAASVSSRTITKSNQLAQVVLVLVRNGDLSAADASTFDAGFPDATKTDRDLTDADVSILKGLK